MQVQIDDIQPIDFPMEANFRAQKTFLIGWTGNANDPRWVRLNDAIDVRLGRGECDGPGLQLVVPTPRMSEAERDWRAHDLDNCTDPGLLRAYAAKWQTVDFVWAYKAQQTAAAVEVALKERQAREAAETAARERAAEEEQARLAREAAEQAAQEQARRLREIEEQSARERPALLAQFRPGSGAAFIDLDIGPEMVVVPAGRFMMGEKGAQREVTFDAPFAMGRYTVTFAEWDAAQAHTDWQRFSSIPPRQPNDHGWGRGKQPVIDVSWEDARAYCAWLSNVTLRSYRLPSEAEWEYCCRAGTTTDFWWGNEISIEQANYKPKKHGSTRSDDHRQCPLPVDSFQPNPWGIYQVHGNVWERCDSSFDKSPSILRGGSWHDEEQFLVSGYRDRFQQNLRSRIVGFRIARTI